ncbi:MAG: chemotaxis response regulator protein-glutamate methylesterase [Desulfococcaceae bacterium]|jgi:two-component system chemotaxis response regulator CheB|nr:chemotaxis response regulator protein-glutamate methylesterase [Desulfococcaceae bacterium]
MIKNDTPLKVLVVDDAILYRTVISEVLSELPGISVVGSAGNGRIATNRIRSLQPDILTLDIEMPEMNGLEVLEWMRENAPDVGAIVFSSFTHKGGDMTVKALNLGAFDFIQKIAADTMKENKAALKNAIVPMLKAFARRKEVRQLLKGKSALPKVETEKRTLSGHPLAPGRADIFYGPGSSVIAIAISTGGPEALGKMLPKIPGDINVPILIVQHMPAAFTQSITSGLNAKSAIEVRAATDGEILRDNTAFFAPGGKQMKIEKSADGKNMLIRVTDDHPENNCKPSADYLFRSIAHHYGNRATGVIMTGMGSDGTLGLKLMKRSGAFIIAQDEETCTVFGMPKKPIETGIVDIVAPLDRIAEEICRTVSVGKQK